MAEGTPAAQWRVNGEPDPHGRQYDVERAALAMGHLTDDEFANALFLNGDVQPSVQQLIDGTAFRPIVWLTAAKERIRWLSRALEREKARSAAAQPSDFEAVFDALGIGTGARTPETLLANVQNLLRREQCLSALERTFFTVQTPPDPAEDQDEPGEDCLLNWGHEPDNYVQAFREALGTLFGALPSFGWTQTSERRPAAGELIVKRWKSGSVWAGVYSGTEKDSSFDEWCALPKDFVAQAVNDLPTEFKAAKAAILSLPEGDIRGLAIAQFIQLQLHQKYPSSVVPRDVRATFDLMADAFLPAFGAKGSAQRERMWQAMVDAAFVEGARG